MPNHGLLHELTQAYYLQVLFVALTINFVKNVLYLFSFFQLKCRLIKENGNPGEAVCKVAKERNVDHVVMGSRGLGTVSRALVGSVSDYCLHHANVPVSVVPPPDRFQRHGFANKN